jgi:hypothetical protein
MERTPPTWRVRTQLHPGGEQPSDTSAVHEHGDSSAVRKELEVPRPQRAKGATVADQRELQPVSSEPLRHVSAVDDPQPEQTPRAAASDTERARVETAHDPAPDAEDDDDAHAQPYSDVVHATRASRQQNESRVVSRGCVSRRNRADVEDTFAARCDADALRA